MLRSPTCVKLSMNTLPRSGNSDAADGLPSPDHPTPPTIHCHALAHVNQVSLPDCRGERMTLQERSLHLLCLPSTIPCNLLRPSEQERAHTRSYRSPCHLPGYFPSHCSGPPIRPQIDCDLCLSGEVGNFIHRNFACRSGICLKALFQPVQVTAIDGQPRHSLHHHSFFPS